MPTSLVRLARDLYDLRLIVRRLTADKVRIEFRKAKLALRAMTTRWRICS